MSQTPLNNKITTTQKMCKSPKSSYQQNVTAKLDGKMIEYENLSTNCTVVGSNNLSLVKKQQQQQQHQHQQMQPGMSPAYSPGYPASPYSSPASLKSPSPSLKPPTPQPTFPVMQLIHNSLLARPIQPAQHPPQQQNIIKLKPHLNILPKPSASPQPSPKPSVSPQIVLPTSQPPTAATLMPTAQPLLLNQMPMLTAPGVQFILRPQGPPTTAKLSQATATPQGLILQPSGQPLIQLQPPRSQPMVRVLTNGVQLAPTTTTYVTQMANPLPAVAPPPQMHLHQHQHQADQIESPGSKNKKPKAKMKKKLDLANIMKLSGIGDEDDIQFESDTSQSESEPTTPHSHSGVIQTNSSLQTAAASLLQSQEAAKKALGAAGIQISGIAGGAIGAPTPVVQVLNQNFHGGMLNAGSGGHPAGIPLNPFITPNFTINNGLMLQRSSGGFKLTVGEDGRLVLQHDPTLNQDLQSQLILQSIFGLNGGLVLQPSIDQQTIQQQHTVQTIQQQSVQTIQQQTVQSQTIQTVQQALQPQIHQQQTVQQTIQHQTVQSQPLGLHQQPLQIVQQPQVHHHSIQPHSLHSQVHSLQSQIQGQIQSLIQNQATAALQHHPQLSNLHLQGAPVQTSVAHTIPTSREQHRTVLQQHQQQQPPPLKMPSQYQKQQLLSPAQQQQGESPGNPSQASYVVNLTPDQLEQLKKNGHLTVNGQTIFMQRAKQPENKKTSPKVKPVKKPPNKIPIGKNFVHQEPHIKINNVHDGCKEKKMGLCVPIQSPPTPKVAMNCSPQSQPSPGPIQVDHIPASAAATVNRSPQLNKIEQKTTTNKIQQQQQQQQQKNNHQGKSEPNGGACPDVEKILGQLLEDSANINIITSSSGAPVPVPAPIPVSAPVPVPVPVPPNAAAGQQQQQQQRIHTIQLTPQKQQHLKSVQLQIQTLSARMTPGDSEVQNALKLLFAEQQKILASGKLLSPDKVFYHNNQLTIVNPSSLNQAPPPVKCENAAPLTISNNNVISSNSGGRGGSDVVISSASATPQAKVVSCNQAHGPRISVPVPVNDNQITNHPTIHIPQSIQPAPPPPPQKISPLPPLQQSPVVSRHSLAKKSQLVEAQLQLDQQEAVKPDTSLPFRDKKDACVRLIRYHCMDQPVLSHKDLNKADEIFELTARHFIGKYARMVDKYKYLLMKESMRQVQTSELMMLDRMFLAEEQQSLIRLRQEVEEGQYQELPPAVPEPAPPPTSSASLPEPFRGEDYDEWACIQRELGCLNESESAPQPSALKRTASSDSRLETLKRFRVDKHNKRNECAAAAAAAGAAGPTGESGRDDGGGGGGGAHGEGAAGENEENNSIDEQVQSAIDSILNLQQSTALDLDSILS